MIRGWLSGTVGLVVTTFVIIVGFAVFAVRIATRSHPEPYAETSAPTKDSTFVYRNSFGIPHITGTSESDVIQAQGYVHAQDRLWQMDLYRRIGRGRLAEVLGRRGVDVDLFMRAIDIAGIARQQWKGLSPTSKGVLEAYAKGVNTYIRDYRGRLPFEFDALAYEPEPWTAEDCLIVGRVIAFDLSVAFWSDIAYAQIAAQRGLDLARLYVPVGRAGEPTVLDSATSVPRRRIATDTTRAAAQAAAGTTAPLDNLVERMQSVRSVLGVEAGGVGSNCWAVARRGSGAIVANDPHLRMGLPATWYQIHLSAPGMNVIGMSIPGMPLVVSGRNDHLAWGVANAMVDDVDYFLEKVDAKNGNYYIDATRGRTKFRYRRDTIRIRGAADSLVDFRLTSRSAVISDVHLLKNPSQLFGVSRRPATSLLNSCITFRWTARSTVSDEILALHRLAHAATLSDVAKAVTTWHAPALTFTVGTAQGSVATFGAGMVPVRGSGDPHVLSPGWEAGTDWRGAVHLSSFGSTAAGRPFVVSANNRFTVRPGVSLGTLYEPSSRAERIAEQLAIYDDYTVRDAQVMQLDVVSPYARQFMAAVLPTLRRSTARMDSVQRRALAIMESWDGSHSPIDPAAAVFSMFLQRMIANTFEDELGMQLYMDYVFVSSNPTRRLLEMLDEPGAPLFDDLRTPQREEQSWIVLRSWMQAIGDLRMQFQNDVPSTWAWGSLHTVTLHHRFSEHPLMRPTLDQGPIPIGGSGTTINNTEWAIHAPFSVRVGASMRVISDMRDTVQYVVVPGGVSGQPLDAHYSDQVQLWLKGGFVRLPVRSKPDISFRLFTVLVPQEA